MKFGDYFLLPNFAWLLLAIPLIWFFLRVVEKRRTAKLGSAIGSRISTLAGQFNPKERTLKQNLFIAALFFALLALLQPFWGEELRQVEARGVDLLVCLDVSQSMLARDLAPNRLARAKREIRALAERLRGDRMGLVAFAGEARLLVPLTQDMDSFAQLVELADTNSVPRGGTNLGAALEQALKALEGASGNHEAVFLITDGEDLEAQGLRIAEICKEKKIVVHCVGFGSAQGSKIAMISDDGSEVFLRDREGKEIVTVMDIASLRRIAEKTGGEFVDAGTLPLPLIELYEKRIVPMSRKSFESEQRQERKNRFQWPLLLAFALWILEFSLTDRKKK